MPLFYQLTVERIESADKTKQIFRMGTRNAISDRFIQNEILICSEISDGETGNIKSKI